MSSTIHLLSKGIETMGTIKTNRDGLPRDGIFPKTGRGVKQRGFCECREKLVDVPNRPPHKVYFTSWMDSKPVHMLSSYQPMAQECVRNTRNRAGEYVPMVLPRPSVIEEYNHGMGGTDLFDQYMQYYSSNMRSERWQVRIFTC